jgi:hypothetical protein
MGTDTLMQTNDAMVWAVEFVRTLKENNWTIEDIDEGLMVGWFANAMCAQKIKTLKIKPKPPRYDEVFFRGLEAMNDMEGE